MIIFFDQAHSQKKIEKKRHLVKNLLSISLLYFARKDAVRNRALKKSLENWLQSLSLEVYWQFFSFLPFFRRYPILYFWGAEIKRVGISTHKSNEALM